MTNCKFYERCICAYRECDLCKFNSSATLQDYFIWNHKGEEPSEKEMIKVLKKMTECRFYERCICAYRECDLCKFNSSATLQDYFIWNHRGEEPSEKEMMEALKEIVNI